MNQLWLGFTAGAAGPVADGWLTILGLGAAGFLRRDSIEILEMKYPVLIHSEHILRDSEGAGRYCGSPALQVEFGPLGSELTAVWLSEGTNYEAIGVQGGQTVAWRASTSATAKENSRNRWVPMNRSRSSRENASYRLAAAGPVTDRPAPATPTVSPATCSAAGYRCKERGKPTVWRSMRTARRTRRRPPL